MNDKKPNILFENCKELISLFLTTGDTFSWPKEISIAKKLLKLWPDILFWRQYDPNSRFHSLSVFLTKPAKIELNKQFTLYNLTKEKEPVKLENEPVINIENIQENNNKNRTLQQFVDNIL